MIVPKILITTKQLFTKGYSEMETFLWVIWLAFGVFWIYKSWNDFPPGTLKSNLLKDPIIFIMGNILLMSFVLATGPVLVYHSWVEKNNRNNKRV